MWRVVQDDAGEFRVEVAEIWALGYRKDGEVYAEFRRRIADAGSSPKTKALTQVLELFAKQARELTATPEPEKAEPVPKWLTDALLYVVSLPSSQVEPMSLDEAEKAWTDIRRVEPAERPDHLHDGPAPPPGHRRQDHHVLSVGVAAMVFAFITGAIGNVLGTAINDTTMIWDVSVAEGANIVLGSLLALLTGTMLGMLFRSSLGALVGYFLYAFVLRGLYGVLTSSVNWFPDVRPWIDLNLAESFLFQGQVTGQQWANIAVTTGMWIIIPALIGLRLVMKSEVK